MDRERVRAQMERVAAAGRYAGHIFLGKVPSIEWAGTFATDGHVSLMLAGDTNGEADAPDLSGAVSLYKPTWRVRISAEKLRAWCPDAEIWPALTECPECKGTGKYKHVCDCAWCVIDDCGPCEECDGKGSYEFCRSACGELARDVFVDRKLVARILEVMEGEITIDGGACACPLRITNGTEVSAYLMRMRMWEGAEQTEAPLFDAVEPLTA